VIDMASESVIDMPRNTHPQIVVIGNQILIAMRDGRALILSLADGKMIAQHQFAAGLRFAGPGPGGRFMVSDGENRLLHVYLESGQLRTPPLHSTHTHHVFAVVCNRFGTVCVRDDLVSRFDKNGAETTVRPGAVITQPPLLRAQLGILLADDGNAFQFNIARADVQLAQLPRLLDLNDGPATAPVATRHSLFVAGRSGKLRRFSVSTAKKQ
jgi:hypothetical protein